MPNGKRASMREGPLAALFRKTVDDIDAAQPDEASGQETTERPAVGALESEQRRLPEQHRLPEQLQRVRRRRGAAFAAGSSGRNRPPGANGPGG